MACLSYNLDTLVIYLRDRVRAGDVLDGETQARLAEMMAELADDARALEDREKERRSPIALAPGLASLTVAQDARQCRAGIDAFLAAGGPGGAA